MSTLRRWVNSPSIDPEKTKIILSEQGEESVEMTASIPLDGELNYPIRLTFVSFTPHFIGGLGQLFCYGSAEGHPARSEDELRTVYRQPYEPKTLHYDIPLQDMLQYSLIQSAALSYVFAYNRFHLRRLCPLPHRIGPTPYHHVQIPISPPAICKLPATAWKVSQRPPLALSTAPASVGPDMDPGALDSIAKPTMDAIFSLAP